MSEYWGYERMEPEPAEATDHAPDGVRHIEASNYTGWVQQCLCGEQFADKAELTQHIAEAEQEERDRLKEQKRQVERALFRNGGLRNFLTARRGS